MIDILKKYNFKFESSISLDITCVVCKDLLKDACQGPCGCLYCLQCIEKYLEDNKKCCPGNTPYCTGDEIIFGVNINRDNSANRKIGRLKVKCPIDSCEFRSELREMCDHLKICGKTELCCPYREFGCSITTMGNADLLEHVQQNSLCHNKMIISWMMNMRIEIMAQQRLENLEMRVSRILIDVTHANEKKQLLIDQLREQLKSVKTENKDLNKLLSQMQGEIFQMKQSIFQQSELNDSTCRLLKSELELLKSRIPPANQIVARQSDMKFDIPIKLLPVKTEKCLDLAPHADLDYAAATLEWVISDLSRLRANRENLCSDWFNSALFDYKMLLCLNPDANRGQSAIQITFNVCDFNAASGRALWPFSAHVKLAICNQSQSDEPIGTGCQRIDRHVNADNPIATLTVDPLCKFDFLYSDLQSSGVDISQPILIRCAVDSFNCQLKH